MSATALKETLDATPHPSAPRAIGLACDSGSDLRVISPDVTPAKPLLNGISWARDLRSGLRLHACAVRSLRGFETEASLAPGLICILALDAQGMLDAAIDGRDLSFAPLPGRERRPDGFLLNVATNAPIVRRCLRGQSIRKVSLTLPATWFDAIAAEGEGPVAEFRRDHLALRRWQPSPRLAEAASQLLSPQFEPNRLMGAIAAETTGLLIVEEALRSLHLPSAEVLSARERAEATRLQAIVEAHLTKPLTIAALAREAGLSARRANTLFQSAYGASIPAYIRRRRLDKAKDGIERSKLTIAQIGFLAGYSSPANFTTAFRRRFGVTPKQARGA